MQLIVGSIDPRHNRIVQAMIDRKDVLLPKTSAKEGKPLVILETRQAIRYGR